MRMCCCPKVGSSSISLGDSMSTRAPDNLQPLPHDFQIVANHRFFGSCRRGCAEQSGACVAAISLARLKSFWLGRCGVLQVDGEMEGDVRRAEVIAGQGGRAERRLPCRPHPTFKTKFTTCRLPSSRAPCLKAAPPCRQRGSAQFNR